MLSSQEKQDKTIRSTDLDALSSRFSANNAHYFVPLDPYIKTLIQSYENHLQYCLGYTSLSGGRLVRSTFKDNKLPLLNRGTYFRIKLIDMIIDQFIEEFGSCQIISLGGGSDTRSFKYLKNKDVIYHELDFPESIKIKKLAILNNKSLREIVGLEYLSETVITSREEFFEYDGEIHSERYHLYGLDMREMNVASNRGDSLFKKLLKSINLTAPTILLSECALCYMPEEDSKRLLEFWEQLFKSNETVVSFLSYDPMSLRDSFGSTMKDNLSRRHINLYNFLELPDLKSRKEHAVDKLHLINVRLTDMSEIAGYGPSLNSWVGIQELQRINKLELIDEVEEIRMLLEHYSLEYGELQGSKRKVFAGINRFQWKEES